MLGKMAGKKLLKLMPAVEQMLRASGQIFEKVPLRVPASLPLAESGEGAAEAL